MGFAGSRRHFEEQAARLCRRSCRRLKGAFLLLVVVAVLSSFIDNIAAARSRVMAREVFRGKVHIGYLEATCGLMRGAAAWSATRDDMWARRRSPGGLEGMGLQWPSSSSHPGGHPAARYSRHEGNAAGLHIEWGRLCVCHSDAAILAT